ncbi:MAG TPA: hypothetical protein VGP72_32260 [Planctomycetota bacterium]
MPSTCTGPREPLTREFLDRLSTGHTPDASYDVVHEYMGCVARKA